jgi:hypothetical protein
MKAEDKGYEVCKQFSNEQCHCYYKSRVINVMPSALITQGQYVQTFNISPIMSVSFHETKNIENVDIGELPLDQIF